MDNEHFLICDIKSFETKTADTIFYLIVYSTLTQETEKVFISRGDYDYYLKNYKSLDMTKCLKRTYNSFKKRFVINFIRN